MIKKLLLIFSFIALATIAFSGTTYAAQAGETIVISEELSKLNKLYIEGVITEEEFSKAKSILLDSDSDLSKEQKKKKKAVMFKKQKLTAAERKQLENELIEAEQALKEQLRAEKRAERERIKQASLDEKKRIIEEKEKACADNPKSKECRTSKKLLTKILEKINIKSLKEREKDKEEMTLEKQAIEERKKNDLLLSLQTSKITNKKLFDSKFLQMRNSQVFSKFSEKRIYYIDDVDKPVDSKYHFGIDLATTANANVYASNTGKVSYVNSNGVGIYGKVTIIDHGLGFYSLYSHLSDISVKVGDEVDKRTLIGKTGQTGYAYGDHLHFSTYIQGVPFDPLELWDKNYINLKIISIYNQFIAEATQ